MAEIYIKDYFKTYNEDKFSRRDWEAVHSLRNQINSFKSEREIYNFLYQRRLNSFNRSEDLRLFGIPLEDTINPLVHPDVPNRYYGYFFGDYKPKEKPIKDYYKRDKYGNIIVDRYGRPKEYGKLGQTLLNVRDNIEDSKVARAIDFTIKHPKLVLISLATIILSLLTVVLIVYVAGTLGSIGHSPFVLCSEDDMGTSSIDLGISEGAIDEITSPEYAARIFIALAEQEGWKKEAIIGALAYILGEGSGMGTFTYEGYYCVTGPSGQLYDKTLDNQAWLNWMEGDGKRQIHDMYYKNVSSSNYASIGLGLLQDSDVWGYSGGQPRLKVSNATRLIEFAESMGRSWQDPEVQVLWILQKFNSSSAWDGDGANPVTDDRTADEWCRRVSAGIGMPAWRWNTTIPSQVKYMQAHTKHIPKAEEYYSRFSGGDLDFSFFLGADRDPCKGLTTIFTAGNGSIADAAVSLAGGDSKILFDKHGSDSPNLNLPQLATYKAVHEAIFPNDSLFASCDRASATAIKWSGADDTFPAGHTGTQYSYLKRSHKWQYVGVFGQVKLQPGDVIITQGRGHIKIYTGNEAVQKRFPGSKANMYQASYQDYFPSLSYEAEQGSKSKVYEVFRCINPDNSDKYKNAAMGIINN